MIKKILIVVAFFIFINAELHAQKYHEYEIWHKLLNYSLSPDGNWALYNIKGSEKSDSLFIINLTTGKEFKMIEAGNPQFSNNSQWVVYSTAGEKSPTSNIQYNTVIKNLNNGEERIFRFIESSNFTAGGKYLLLIGESQNSGRELSFYNLETGAIRSIHKIKSYSINANGQLVAYSVKTANGYSFEVLDINSGAMVYNTNSDIEYENITWREDKLVYQNTADSVQCISIIDGIAARKPKITTLSAADAGFGADKTINFANKLIWSKDNRMIFFTLCDKATVNTKPKVANLDIWHWKDERSQARQRNRYYSDIRKGYICVWFPYENRWRQITDSTFTSVLSISIDGKYITATDDSKYRPHFREEYRDVYLVSTATSERTLLLENSPLTPSFSPKSNYLHYFKDKNWFLYDIAIKKHIDITSSLGVDFGDKDYDGPIGIVPSYGNMRWSDDERCFWVFDEFDIWSVDTKKIFAKRITNGRKDKISFRKTNIGEIGKKETIILKATGNDYQMGLYSLTENGNLTKIFYDGRNILSLQKAKNNSSFLYALESNIESPELLYIDLKSGARKKLYETDLKNKNFKFRKSEVVYFKNSKGEELRGALFYPVNYSDSLKYPMIVHIYERLSDKVNSFVYPSAKDAYNSTNFTLNGYFVFQPDIAYEVNNPGISASDCVISSVKEVVLNYNVDSNAIGLIGHSWGAYQTALIISQTDMFKAAIAGAPLTNMITMYNSLYKENGRLNQEMFETSQGRFRKPWWEIRDNFINNSPIFQAAKINTPLMMIFGEDDNSVDWSQGCEMYVTMRRQGKPCIMLSYKGEGHSIGAPENLLDQSKRVLDYFEYYLKGSQPPKWIEHGKSYIEKMKGE